MIESIITIVICLLGFYGVVCLATDRSHVEKGAAVVWVLNRSPEGMYAKEISLITGVSYSQVYIVLSRLQDSGSVKYMRDAQWPHRFRYFISKQN